MENDLIDYDSLASERRDYLLGLLTAVGASSTSSAKLWSGEYRKRKICCEQMHFPEQQDVLPIPITCEIFSRIFKIFNDDTISPTTDSVRIAKDAVAAMRGTFTSEADRVDAFHAATNPFLAGSKAGKNSTGEYKISSNNGPDGFIEVDVPLLEGKKALVCLIEGQHESGSSNDPIVQVHLDYSKYAGEMLANEIPGQYPCLLVALSGTSLTVHFGIVGKNVTICSLYDDFQLQGVDCIVEAAKLFIKLQSAVSILAEYYRDLQPDNDAWHPHSLPFKTSFNVYGNDVRVKYVRQIKMSSTSIVYEVKVVEDAATFADCSLIVKFCRQYNIAAHQLLAGENRHTNVAPMLYATEAIHGGLWNVLLMEKIDDALTLIAIRQLAPEARALIARDVAQAVGTLQQEGFIHGDLRYPNILVIKANTVLRTYIIDFEFTGREGDALYPPDLDLGIFTWVDVEDFPHVLKQHDWEALKTYCRYIRANTST